MRTDGRTDVRTDGHVTVTSQPKFLGLIGYHISLAMELRWQALPTGSANMDVNSCVMEDIKRRNENFMTPHRHLANAVLSVVGRNIQNYRIECLTSESNLKPQDPLSVDRILLISVLEASQEPLLKIVSKKTRKRIEE